MPGIVLAWVDDNQRRHWWTRQRFQGRAAGALPGHVRNSRRRRRLEVSWLGGEENEFLVQTLPLNAQTAVVLQDSGIELVQSEGE